MLIFYVKSLPHWEDTEIFFASRRNQIQAPDDKTNKTKVQANNKKSSKVRVYIEIQ